MPVTLTPQFRSLSDHEIFIITERLAERLELIHDRMIDKAKVAELAGMTVSWLNNSNSEKALRLRQSAVRYGRGQSSPVMFSQVQVMRICREDESAGHQPD